MWRSEMALPHNPRLTIARNPRTVFQFGNPSFCIVKWTLLKWTIIWLRFSLWVVVSLYRFYKQLGMKTVDHSSWWFLGTVHDALLLLPEALIKAKYFHLPCPGTLEFGILAEPDTKTLEIVGTLVLRRTMGQCLYSRTASPKKLGVIFSRVLAPWTHPKILRKLLLSITINCASPAFSYLHDT